MRRARGRAAGPVWTELASAMCLVLVLEGLLPFAAPGLWRSMVARAAEADDAALRLSGFVMMMLGAALLFVVR